MRILLIDNDESLVESLKQNLSRQNYVVDAVTTGEAGWQYGSTYPYDLIILDWVLPGIDGITLCQKFRVNGYHFPILILTTRNSSQDKARGLDAGADDYLGKPFDLEELGARIRALLRRDNTEPLPIIVWENIQLDPCSCEVAYDGHLLSLTAKEYGLLELLLRHHHYVLQTEEIIDNLWSSEEYPAEATVRSHLRSLRQKLKQAGAPGDLIETVRGVGYRLKTLTNPGHVLTSAAPPEPPNPPMTGLTAIWGKYQKQQQIQLAILDQTLDQTLAQMVAAIQSGLNFSPNPSHWEQAKLSACKLSESLELFGFDQGSRLAHTLEHLLQQFPQPDLQTSEFTDFVKQFQVTLRALHQELAVAPEMLTPKKQFADFNPVALLVSEENSFAQSLVKAAQSTGIRTFLAPTLAAAKNLLYPETSPSWQMPLRPDIVVVKLTFQRSLIR
ncbi:MAG: response regulator transcription factor [Oscillatoriales cyanobacterium RM1_1_9]|nr:response regulator transcription factor [Oscillatoriales cyanobacterium SM2_3_0]NJO71367.1 response regulator transcription factor [Oscillatoriales cyanobacterium RM1_1_9]